MRVLLRKALQSWNQPVGTKAWVGGDAYAFGAVAIRQHFQRSVFYQIQNMGDFLQIQLPRRRQLQALADADEQLDF